MPHWLAIQLKGRPPLLPRSLKINDGRPSVHNLAWMMFHTVRIFVLVRDGSYLAPAGIRYARMPPGRFLVRGCHVVVAWVTHGRFGMVGIVIGRAVIVIIVVWGQVHILIALILKKKQIISNKKTYISKTHHGITVALPVLVNGRGLHHTVAGVTLFVRRFVIFGLWRWHGLVSVAVRRTHVIGWTVVVPVVVHGRTT